LIARATTLSIFCMRAADIPTADGSLEGRPPSVPPAPAKKNSELSNDVSNK